MENNNKHTPVITVRWDEDLSQYKVDVPQWQGGEVVMLEAHKSIVASLTRELSELREERDRLRLTLSGKTFFDEKEVMQKEIDGLREENERLKEGLMKIKAELFEQGEGYIASIINELLQSKKP
jgi:hypothetical protein